MEGANIVCHCFSFSRKGNSVKTIRKYKHLGLMIEYQTWMYEIILIESRILKSNGVNVIKRHSWFLFSHSLQAVIESWMSLLYRCWDWVLKLVMLSVFYSIVSSILCFILLHSQFHSLIHSISFSASFYSIPCSILLISFSTPLLTPTVLGSSEISGGIAKLCSTRSQIQDLMGSLLSPSFFFLASNLLKMRRLGILGIHRSSLQWLREWVFIAYLL